MKRKSIISVPNELIHKTLKRQIHKLWTLSPASRILLLSALEVISNETDMRKTFGSIELSLDDFNGRNKWLRRSDLLQRVQERFGVAFSFEYNKKTMNMILIHFRSYFCQVKLQK